MQSSGGYLSCTLSVSPLARGLFSRVVIESGPCVGGPPGRGWGPGSLQQGLAVSRRLMKALNVSGIAGLRAIRNASSIQAKTATLVPSLQPRL